MTWYELAWFVTLFYFMKSTTESQQVNKCWTTWSGYHSVLNHEWRDYLVNDIICVLGEETPVIAYSPNEIDWLHLFAGFVHYWSIKIPWLSMTTFTKFHVLKKLETKRVEQGLHQTSGSRDPVSELKCTAKLWYIKVTSTADTILRYFSRSTVAPRNLKRWAKKFENYSLIQKKSNFPWLSVTDT